MLRQCIRQSARAPDEHAAVPEEVTGFHELLSNIGHRLLGESLHLKHALLRFSACLDVTITCFSASWLNADDDDVRALRSDFSSAADIFAKTLFVEDDMVRREQAEYSTGIEPSQQERRKPDRRGRIAADRLGDDLPLLQFLQLTKNGVAQIFIRDDPEILVLCERLQPLDRLLDHAFLAVERQQLLGHALAAQRPEARATSTCENDGIEVEVN